MLASSQSFSANVKSTTAILISVRGYFLHCKSFFLPYLRMCSPVIVVLCCQVTSGFSSLLCCLSQAEVCKITVVGTWLIPSLFHSHHLVLKSFWYLPSSKELSAPQPAGFPCISLNTAAFPTHDDTVRGRLNELHSGTECDVFLLFWCYQIMCSAWGQN